jgi:hypothetical protein
MRSDDLSPRGSVLDRKKKPAHDERRTAARHFFTASAEVIDRTTGAKFSTRTSDLGPGGCFVDTMVPFPVGSRVHIVLRKGKNSFEADGTVVYAQIGLGMGIAFNEISQDQATALREWLADVSGDRETAYEILRAAASVPGASGSAVDRSMIARLINVLVHKGVITETEGSSILYDPVL